MKTKIVCICFILLTISGLTACDRKKPSYTIMGSEYSYVNEDRMDAQNYSMYVNKELALLTNILEAHMATAERIKNNTSIISNEITTLEEDITKVNEAIETIQGIYPPEKYDDDRLIFLRRMENTKTSLEDYKLFLKTASVVPDENVDELNNYISAMETSFTELKSSFNNWTE